MFKRNRIEMVYGGSNISAFSFLKKFVPKKRIIDVKLIKTPIQGEYILRIQNNTNQGAIFIYYFCLSHCYSDVYYTF